MENINEILSKLNFTKNEALVYTCLLENPGMTVYQISKELNISRSSIYPVIEKMYVEGSVLLENSDRELYYPQEPEVLMNKITNEFQVNIKKARETLKKISVKNQREVYLNYVNYSAIIEKTILMIDSAQEEVLMNTDINYKIFEKALERAYHRGVKIYLFSFKEISLAKNDYFIFSHHHHFESQNRLMIVCDNNEVLVANISLNNLDWVGTHTFNPLMVRIVSEHIHHDIYLLKIKNSRGEDLFEMHPEILINSLMEKDKDGGKIN